MGNQKAKMVRYQLRNFSKTSSVSITFSPLRLRISSSVVSRLSCSPVVLPRASTRSSTFHLSWFASSPSLTSSSPTPHHSVVDAQAASRGRPQPAVAVMRMTSKRYAPTRVITHISAFKNKNPCKWKKKKKKKKKTHQKKKKKKKKKKKS